MFWFFGHEACGILAPQPGIEPAPPTLEGKVLSTGPPGKSQMCIIYTTHTYGEREGRVRGVIGLKDPTRLVVWSRSPLAPWVSNSGGRKCHLKGLVGMQVLRPSWGAAQVNWCWSCGAHFKKLYFSMSQGRTFIYCPCDGLKGEKFEREIGRDWERGLWFFSSSSTLFGKYDFLLETRSGQWGPSRLLSDWTGGRETRGVNHEPQSPWSGMLVRSRQ